MTKLFGHLCLSKNLQKVKVNNKKKMLLLLLLFFTKSEILTKKCLKWKNSLKVSCGYIYSSQNYAEVEWYFRNQKILRSIDEFCETCNLKNELFMFELDEKYKIYFENEKMVFVNIDSNILYETDEIQNFECFQCFLNLYK